MSVLRAAGVTVRFGGLVANRDLSLEVTQGQTTALVGPNGAGKTTFLDVLSGIRRPSEGVVHLGGEDVTALGPEARAVRGLSRTFQNLSLCGELSVLDNVIVGLARFRHGSRAGRARAFRAVAQRALELVGLDEPDRPAGSLPYGDRRRLEIARAVAAAPRVLLLDEPVAGMGPEESAEVARLVRTLQSELGIAVLVVEHDLAFVRAVASATTVLEFGNLIASGSTPDVLADPEVVRAYTGTAA